MSNPKIFARSRPCVLIGYSPHSKAYRPCDTTPGSIFDSFHVSFIEHLDEHPTKLLLGTAITLGPSWETALAPRTSNLQQPHYIPSSHCIRSRSRSLFPLPPSSLSIITPPHPIYYIIQCHLLYRYRVINRHLLYIYQIA